jgi:hypothetical protein
MFTLSTKNQWLVGSVLLLAMLATRAHLTDHLQDASWAIFFMAGFYLRNRLALVPFMLAAAAIDYVAVTWAGVSSFCVSSAYVALVPAYGALYAAGRWLAGHYRENPSAVFPLAASLLVGIVACEVISSGSFYFLSGRVAETSLGGFAHDLVEYLPHSLSITSFYVGIGALLHVAVLQVNRMKGNATA